MESSKKVKTVLLLLCGKWRDNKRKNESSSYFLFCASPTFKFQVSTDNFGDGWKFKLFSSFFLFICLLYNEPNSANEEKFENMVILTKFWFIGSSHLVRLLGGIVKIISYSSAEYTIILKELLCIP